MSAALGAQNAVLGGGRYDDMMKDFGGPDLCGIGFALGMERLLATVDLPVPARKLLYIACLGEEARREGMKAARFFRRHGVATLIEYKDRGMKAHFSRANRLKADWVLTIGEQELRSGRFGLKDMAAGSQYEGGPEELLARLKPGP